MDRPTVFIVEDDAAARAAMVQMLGARGYATAAFESAEAFLDAADRTQPGCLVCDICLPGISGLELQKRLSDEQCPLPVILLTAYGDVPSAVEAMQRGAVTYIEKPCRPTALVTQVQQAIDTDAQRRRQQAIDADLERRLDELTEQEIEVLEGIVSGKANKSIAYHLNIGLRTVEQRRSEVMRKFDAENLPDLVKKVMRTKRFQRNQDGSEQLQA